MGCFSFALMMREGPWFGHSQAKKVLDRKGIEGVAMRKFVYAAVAYVAIVMVIAPVWHLALFKSVYAAARMREQPLFQLGLASIAIQAAILAWSFPRCSIPGTPAKKGLKFGLLAGLLLGSLGALAEAGKYDVGSIGTFIACEGAFFLVQYAIVGLAIGLIHGVAAEQGTSATRSVLGGKQEGRERWSTQFPMTACSPLRRSPRCRRAGTHRNAKPAPA